MSFSVKSQLTVLLPGTVLYIAYASLIWWTTYHSLTTIWKFSFKNGMKSKEKCSFQLECGFEITTSISNCWWSILRTATLDKPSIKTICHFSILMTIVFFVCNVAKLVSSIFNVTIIFSFNIATGLLRTSSWFWAFEAVPSCNPSWNKSEKTETETDYQQIICHALCLWVGFLKPKTSCKNIVLFA